MASAPHRTGGGAKNTERIDIELESWGHESPERNVGEKIGRRQSDRVGRWDLGPAQKVARGTGERPRGPGTGSIIGAYRERPRGWEQRRRRPGTGSIIGSSPGTAERLGTMKKWPENGDHHRERAGNILRRLGNGRESKGHFESGHVLTN